MEGIARVDEKHDREDGVGVIRIHRIKAAGSGGLAIVSSCLALLLGGGASASSGEVLGDPPPPGERRRGRTPAWDVEMGSMPKDVERNMGGARVWLGIDRSFPGFESGTRTPKGLVESGGGRTTELRDAINQPGLGRGGIQYPAIPTSPADLTDGAYDNPGTGKQGPLDGHWMPTISSAQVPRVLPSNSRE
ncbi:hypothetical protein CCHR01_16503 [Colletotrichum chrysophilum]|uniref:Uncharacterized protein n=1 Tax=Colletotrichum chrysophilum TaxID=1836956 RepID=A0AAD9A4C2_9PEZI|nr:hypothetical protein CCHR01_16503 [Colletotrichum chrysophilum]